MEEVQAQIIARGVADQEFRARLLADPRAAIREEFGVTIPERVMVEVHEDGGNVAHLVLPATGKLDEAALQFAFGGWAPGGVDADGNPAGPDTPGAPPPTQHQWA